MSGGLPDVQNARRAHHGHHGTRPKENSMASIPARGRNSHQLPERATIGLPKRKLCRLLLAAAGVVVAVTLAASAGAFQALPPGAQVNDDPAVGIDKTLGVDGGEPTNAGVVGGALTAGKPAV